MSHDPSLDDLLPAFLQEASELLAEVGSLLAILEKAPHNKDILNIMFRNFHTIKGGAGFIKALGLADTDALVSLCRTTESLLNQLRNKDMPLVADLHTLISTSTAEVFIMLNDLRMVIELKAPPQTLLQSLETALQSVQAPMPSCLGHMPHK